jgi:hypothetical protein
VAERGDRRQELKGGDIRQERIKERRQTGGGRRVKTGRLCLKCMRALRVWPYLDDDAHALPHAVELQRGQLVEPAVD